MYQNSIAQNIEGMIGYLAWAIVCYLTLNTQATNTVAGQVLMLATVLGLLLYIIGFYFTTRTQTLKKHDLLSRQVSIIIQFIAVIIIRLLTDSSVVVILSVAMVALLPIYFSRLTSLLGMIGLISIDYLFNAWIWILDDAIVWTALGGAFHLFAFRMSQRVIQEQEARNQIATLNRELIATQALLEQSTKQSERLRISRDLHDGLGHHLTALILKLQYLTYTTTGETKEQITTAHLLAKELLQDVRTTVHEMREKAYIGFFDALDALIAQVPNLEIKTDIDRHIALVDVPIIEALFRTIQEAITNTLRHAEATELTIRLINNEGVLELTISDNGQKSPSIIEGNGLSGMKERVEAVSGNIDWWVKNGFNIAVTIPCAEAL